MILSDKDKEEMEEDIARANIQVCSCVLALLLCLYAASAVHLWHQNPLAIA